MQSTDAPTAEIPAGPPPRNFVSVAILAAVACMPIVVAAGFISDRAQPAVSVPGDISVLALRGMIDGGPERPPSPPARAGY